ncbi:uncharacterized protein LOC125469047 [Pyrus x bretschneideri]|uniref:uncharacterized protein LOC125469047 n=1 Tax=Pyrus x bretschneideri TaxID=225117 RepID=UPI00202DEB98|nr:uncharacterized protein LOC125469047 [Pyrus x bretschneideri]
MILGYSSSSRGWSFTAQRRGDRFLRGFRFQRQKDYSCTGALLCRRCNNMHFGDCRQGNRGGCFVCEQMGHRALQCPQSQQKLQPSPLPPPVPNQQIPGPSGYTRRVMVEHIIIRLVDHGGISEGSPRTLRLLLTVQDHRGSLIILVKDVKCKDVEIKVYQGCHVLVEDVVMPVNLVPLNIIDFDVILGVDWLHYNRAKMDYYEKTITFHRPGLPVVTFVGVRSGLRQGFISVVRAKKLLRKGCQGYLAHVVLNEDKPTHVEDVRVVRHFLDVFPDDLPGSPPDGEVEFTIDLLLELRELKTQLQEFVDKGFIQHSISP